MFDATILFYILFLLNCSLGEGNFILYFITIKLFAWKHTNVISFFFLREAKEPRVSVPPKCHHVNGSSSALSVTVIGTIVSPVTPSRKICRLLATILASLGPSDSIRTRSHASSIFHLSPLKRPQNGYPLFSTRTVTRPSDHPFHFILDKYKPAPLMEST